MVALVDLLVGIVITVPDLTAHSPASDNLDQDCTQVPPQWVDYLDNLDMDILLNLDSEFPRVL